LQIAADQIKLKVTTEHFTVSDEPKKQDPFKPQEPNIPGVTGNPARSKPSSEEPRPIARQTRNSASGADKIPARKWLAIAAIAIGLVSLTLFLWKRSSTSGEAQAVPAAAPVIDHPPVAAQSPPSVPVGPGPVATTLELAKPWSSKRFTFRASQTTDNLPALVVHLPSGVYWGLSMREPFGNCELEYVTDLQKLARVYDFQAVHPMVGNPCNHAVYDLARYGTGLNGPVRGAIVSGGGVRPPMEIEIKVRGQQIVATQLEH
jgi:hypothetical protein